jgi:hypothetical protein
MRLIVILIALGFLGANPVCTEPAKPQSEAAAHFIQAERLRKDGRLEEAANEYILALQLKPDSSLSKDRLLEVQAGVIAALRTELADARAKAKLPVEAASQAYPQPAASASVDLRDDLIRTQDQTIISLKRQIAEIRMRFPDVFGPPIAPRKVVVARYTLDGINAVIDQVQAVLQLKDCTRAQTQALLDTIQAVPISVQVQVQDVIRLKDRPGIHCVIVGSRLGRYKVAMDIPLSDAAAVGIQKGANCQLSGIVGLTEKLGDTQGELKLSSAVLSLPGAGVVRSLAPKGFDVIKYTK